VIVCVCTAGKDRSPAMARVVHAALEGNRLGGVAYAGISKNRTRFHETPHVSAWLYGYNRSWKPNRPGLILCATRQHYDYVRGWFDGYYRDGFHDYYVPPIIDCRIKDFDGDLTERDKARLIRLVRRHYGEQRA
jgi:hypothetical protein